MSMTKDGVIWITNSRGSIGIVTKENDEGQKLAYISSVDGHNQEQDIQTIKEWGGKFRPEMAEFLFRWLCPHKAQAMDSASTDLFNIVKYLNNRVHAIREETEKEAGFTRAGTLLKNLNVITEIQEWIVDNCGTFKSEKKDDGTDTD